MQGLRRQRMRALEEVPLRLQRVPGGAVLLRPEEVLRLRRGRGILPEEQKGAADLQGDKRGRPQGDGPHRHRGGQERPVHPPHLRQQPNPPGDVLREDRQKVPLPRLPQRQGARIAAVRALPAQVRLRGEEEGGQRREDVRPHLRRLQEARREEPGGERLAVRLRRGQGGRQEGDPHHHLPGVPLPVRLPDHQAERLLRAEEDQKAPEAARRALLGDIPGEPLRQRRGVREVPRDRGPSRRREPLQGLLHEPLQGHRQGGLREEPRVRRRVHGDHRDQEGEGSGRLP